MRTGDYSSRLSRLRGWLNERSEIHSRLCGEDYTRKEVLHAHILLVLGLAVLGLAESHILLVLGLAAVVLVVTLVRDNR